MPASLTRLYICVHPDACVLESVAGLSNLQRVHVKLRAHLGIPASPYMASLEPLTALRGSSLQHLVLEGGHEVESLQPLSVLTALTMLMCSSFWKISDLSPLTRLTSLQRLRLPDFLKLTHLGPLSALRGLRALDVSMSNWVSEWGALASLTQLSYLDCAFVRLSSLEPLAL